jgi:hypothetical protein
MRLIRFEEWMKLDHEYFNRMRMVLYLTVEPVSQMITGMILYGPFP